MSYSKGSINRAEPVEAAITATAATAPAPATGTAETKAATAAEVPRRAGAEATRREDGDEDGLHPLFWSDGVGGNWRDPRFRAIASVGVEDEEDGGEEREEEEEERRKERERGRGQEQKARRDDARKQRMLHSRQLRRDAANGGRIMSKKEVDVELVAALRYALRKPNHE